MPIKQQTIEEKIQTVAVLNNKVKELSENATLAQAVADDNGMVDIFILTGGERRRAKVPFSLLADYFNSEATTVQADLTTAQATLNG